MKIEHKANRWTFVFFLTLSLGACDQTADTANQKETGSASQAHDHSQHTHANVDIHQWGIDTPIPSISFTIQADTMSGWNINLHTDNFVFTPDKVNSKASPGEGHAHIYVDDYKLARLYGPWYHLKKLTPGPHQVRISLNANDHSNWSQNGEVISATQTIIQR